MTAIPLSYDVLNRLAQAAHTVNGAETFRYTTGNRRVWSKGQSANSMSEYISVYGFDGQKMARYKGGDHAGVFKDG